MIKALVFDAYGTLFDTQSVWRSVESAYPGRGIFITDIWRQKQLEYTWQRTAMGNFTDFAALTRDALDYAVRTITPNVDAQLVEALSESFNQLDLYANTAEALASLCSQRLALLSNGSSAMLAALLEHAGLNSVFEHIICSDDVRRYKPHPEIYRAAVTRLELLPHEVALVSSNGFDLAGARNFGLPTIRIERTSSVALQRVLLESAPIPSEAAFLAVRSQADLYAGQPDFICTSLLDVANIVAANISAADPTA